MPFKNLLANYIGTGLIGLINMASLAFYVRWFGLDHWGQIATFVALMNTLMILESGISQIYISEFHKVNPEENLFRKYQGALFALAISGVAASTFIYFVVKVTYEAIPDVYQKWELFLLALILFSFNLINNFYYTNLIAEERQIQQNVRWVFFIFLKNALVLFISRYVSNEPEFYFFGFLFVGSIEIFLNSRTVNYPILPSWKFDEFIEIVKKCSGLSVAIGLGIFVFNLDRLVFPSILDVPTFGVYATVTTIGLYFLQFQYPITKALYPLIAKKIHLDGKQAQSVMLEQTFLLASLMVPPLLLGGFFAKNILTFYLVPEDLLSDATNLFDGILFAVLINAAYHGIYMRLVIEGRDKVILFINLLTLFVSLFVLLTVGPVRPFVGGALAWISVSFIQLIGSGIFYLGEGRSEYR